MTQFDFNVAPPPIRKIYITPILSTMPVGASFFFPNEEFNKDSVRSSMWHLTHKNPERKYTIRTFATGVRVWRLEDRTP